LLVIPYTKTEFCSISGDYVIDWENLSGLAICHAV
jgi:hypothetical protein